MREKQKENNCFKRKTEEKEHEKLYKKSSQARARERERERGLREREREEVRRRNTLEAFHFFCSFVFFFA